MDHENGGVYTCLDRKGEIYSTDKSVWMQGALRVDVLLPDSSLRRQHPRLARHRQGGMACRREELHRLPRGALRQPRRGRSTLLHRHGRRRPLRQRRYCFSEGFYTIANAEYYGITGDEEYLARARRAYAIYYGMMTGTYEDPTGLGPKTIADTRSGYALGDPMILLNIIGILRRVDPAHAEEYDRHSKECTDRIVNWHYRPELGCTLESVNLDGEPELWYTAGRVVNPGHDIECSWFMMDEANYRGDEELHRTAEEMFRLAIEAGWDDEFGGLLYFIDAKGPAA